MRKLLGVSAALLLLFVFACPSMAAEKVFVFGRAADTVALDPADVTDGQSNKVTGQIFDTLVTFANDSTEIVPCLATSWETSEDGLTWTFHLRKDVKFHDGTPFNADAVVFSFERQRDKEHPAHQGKFAYWNSMFSLVEYTKKIDDMTIEMKLKTPYAPFLSNMGVSNVRIVSPTAMMKDGVEYSRSHPVGTGAFKFVEWKKGDRIVLEANDDYWGGRPFLDRLIFRVFPDDTARVMALLAGEVHGIADVTPDNINMLKQEKRDDLKVIANVGMNVGYISMNMDKKPFDNLKVRQAIAHSVNKEQIVKDIFKGMADPAKNILPPTLWGYNDDVKDYEFDLDKAKQLLVEAGYPDGFETEMWYMPVSRPYLPESKLVAQVIQRDLSKIGVKVNLLTFDWATYLSKMSDLEHTICMRGWMGDNGDPDNFLYVLFDKDQAVKGQARNSSAYRSEEYHNYMIEAQKTIDVKKRAELYKAAQQLFHDDMPAVPLAHGYNLALTKKNVVNFTFSSIGAVLFHKVDFKD